MTQHFSPDDALWFKDAVIYEVPVKSFMDSDGDGIGDFRGLTDKLDYIQDLGVTAVWILPFFPSPLRDDGYDISDYVSVNPIYGDLNDFQIFLDAAHQRGIRVIIELIVNHTSDQHPWFQRSRKAPPGSWERDFYVWSDTPETYSGVRIIFQDFETSNWTWDPVAQAYYWHRFYSHQPDLNFEHPALQEALFNAVDFWLERGVDGMRLDAVPYLYEQDGTNCENLPKTHEFLKKLRSHIDSTFPGRMLLAEANQWPEDAATYYGQGDECHMNFHFPLMPRLFMSVQMEDSFPILDILHQTPQIPDNCQWAIFLRNHDELTLEMVSDEDRDYMYKVYAQDRQARINLGIRRRLAPLMQNNRRRIELMNSLLLSLPGTPVLYYGDEIGMGDNFYLGDRNGVRTPMQWNGDRNAGFSKGNPQRLYLPIIVDPEYNYETINVEAQRTNPSSLWWWMKRILGVRSRHQAFGRGTFEFLYPENRKVLAFLRTYQGEHILVVANMSRFAQGVELDLSAFQGVTPMEIFGQTDFPPVGETPYFLSLGPHSFYWFALQPSAIAPTQPVAIPTLRLNGSWRDIYSRMECKKQLEAALPNYLQTRRWCNVKGRLLQQVELLDTISLVAAAEAVPEQIPIDLVLFKVFYTTGMPETYALPIAYVPDADLASEGVIVQLAGAQPGVLIDAISQPQFWTIPWDLVMARSQVQGSLGTIAATSIPAHGQAHVPAQLPTQVTAQLLPTQQTNSFLLYVPQSGDRYLFKWFYQVDECINSDYEVTQFLTAANAAPMIAPVLGMIEYRRKGTESMTIGMLQKFVPETISAWDYSLDCYRTALETSLTQDMMQTESLPMPPLMLSMALTTAIPDLATQVLGSFLQFVERLGDRTAQLHLALAADTDNPAFAPEPFTLFYQRSIYQYMRDQAGKNLLRLRKEMKHFPEASQQLAQSLLTYEYALMERYRRILENGITTTRIRCHGNYHLEEVLYTGKDFVMVDFEGEATRSLSERRMKRSPLRDVAGLMESLYYAAQVALRREVETGAIRSESLPRMEEWTKFLSAWASLAFLQQYLKTAGTASFIPPSEIDLQVLLEAFLLEKAIYEMDYELDHRPDWLNIPLKRILELLGIGA